MVVVWRMSLRPGLAPSDCFVQLSGGTPEGIVGAILMGFQHVIYVGTDRERDWMKPPTKQEEQLHRVDYDNYVSPDMEAGQHSYVMGGGAWGVTPKVCQLGS